jgi:hypothetical protein
MEEKGEGVNLLLQRIGGVIQGVSAIFSSWNGEVFKLSETMRDKLMELGILDFVIKLGTWAIRIKELFTGIASGFFSAFDGIMEPVGGLLDSFAELHKALTPLLELLGIGIGKIESWSYVGEVLGYILGYLVAGPIKLLVAGIENIVMGVVGLIRVFRYLGSAIVSAFEYAGTKAENLLEKVFNFKETMVNLGSNLMEAIWEGMKNKWELVKNWASNALAAVNPFSDGNDGSGEVNSAQSPGGAQQMTPEERMRIVNDNETSKSAPQQVVRERIEDKRTESLQVDLVLDGDEIHKQTIEREKEQEARE